MTLEPYDPARLDALSLRVVDICARLRTVARMVRDEGVSAITLHDRKPLEWIEKLEAWAVSAEAEAQRQVQLAKAARRAKELDRR